MISNNKNVHHFKMYIKRLPNFFQNVVNTKMDLYPELDTYLR